MENEEGKVPETAGPVENDVGFVAFPKGMRSFNASGAVGRDVSSPRSHQMCGSQGPTVDLCWMSPDTLRWQLWRSEWWCPETHVRLLSGSCQIVLMSCCFFRILRISLGMWDCDIPNEFWMGRTEALTEATARSVSCLVLKQANPVHKRCLDGGYQDE